MIFLNLNTYDEPYWDKKGHFWKRCNGKIILDLLATAPFYKKIYQTVKNSGINSEIELDFLSGPTFRLNGGKLEVHHQRFSAKAKILSRITLGFTIELSDPLMRERNVILNKLH